MKTETSHSINILSLVLLAAATATIVWALLVFAPGGNLPEAAEPTPGPTPNPTPIPNVTIDGVDFPWDTKVLSFPEEAPPLAELMEKLSQFPRLERVEIPNYKYSYSMQNRLQTKYPDIIFIWPVEVWGERFSSEAESLSFAGREDLTARSLSQIQERAVMFPNLKSVDLTGCQLEGTALHALDTALEGVDVVYTFPLYDLTVCSTDKEIDLSEHKIKDAGAELAEILDWMPYLERVDLCDTGVSDQSIMEMQDRHENVRFIWMVPIMWLAVRSDTDYFIPYAQSGIKYTGRTTGLKGLWYCPDLVALDLGHSNSLDLEFLSVMPHMKYLIVAGASLSHFSEVGNLKELQWLEMFLTRVDDVSALAQCTSLEHLNICHINTSGDILYETLRQMTWLKRLWCTNAPLTQEQLASLREELPDCEIWYERGGESTAGTWRYDEAYYEMRDAFHMFYMGPDGGNVKRLTPEELEAMHDKYWKNR